MLYEILWAIAEALIGLSFFILVYIWYFGFNTVRPWLQVHKKELSPRALITLIIFTCIITTSRILATAQARPLEDIETLGRTALTEVGINPDTLTAIDKNIQPKTISAEQDAQIATTIHAIETCIADHIKELHALLADLTRKQTFITQMLPIAVLHCTPEQLKFARIQMGFLKYEIMLCEKLIQAFEAAANLSFYVRTISPNPSVDYLAFALPMQ
jgi:hypothetical protein